VTYLLFASCVRFSFSVLSREIGREERLKYDLFWVGWDVKSERNQATDLLL